MWPSSGARPWRLLLIGFVGVNMMQESITGFCPAAMLFRALGARAGVAFQQGAAIRP